MRRIKTKYWKQRQHAKRRGIPFELTFEQWLEWWGDDLDLRGRGKGKLQMCRFNDTGPYAIGNIYKATCEENSSYKFALGFRGRVKLLNEPQVDEVKRLLQDGFSTRKAAELVGTNQKTVMRIKHGKY